MISLFTPNLSLLDSVRNVTPLLPVPALATEAGMSNQQHFQSSQIPVPSPDGALIAFVASTQLHIRSARTFEDVQIYDLPPGFDQSCQFIRWYGAQGRASQCPSQRLLLADDTKILIYDIAKSHLYAEISGATTMTKLYDVDFGWTPDEVMIFSDFGFKLQIWTLSTKRAVEIKDPKIIAPCYSYRPNTGHLAILTRPAAHDVLLIVAPQSHQVLSTSELSTVDARGIEYSPDGNWLAVFDTASAGTRVIVLTGDGHHFRNYSVPQDDLTLGARCIQWSPTGDHLAIGDHQSEVTLLGKKTFSPDLRFLHHRTVEIPKGIVWQEELSASRSRSYAQAKQPATSPSHDEFQATKKKSSGIALMEFNRPQGDMLASSSSDTPSTLWIRSIEPSSCHTMTALIHHSPIKALLWHPVVEDLLLVQCAIAEPTVHLWKADWSEPKILSLPLKAPAGKFRATWLASDADRIRLMLSNAEQSAIKQFTHHGEEVIDPIGRLGPEAMFDEGNSLDLSSVERHDTPAIGLSTELGQTLEVEDTFHYRHQHTEAT
ncbi:MAG: hypothetical protein Q9168_001893 [Polycauliona sp. 1 TL-2023]